MLAAIIISALLAFCGMQPLVFPAAAWAAGEQATYVGMEKCKDCHPKHVETYYTWKYSRNFRIIQMRKREHDPKCLRCHTTGYGAKGGFSSVEDTPGMANKQCECCHGPASLHLKAPNRRQQQKTLTIPKNICTRCHSGHRHPGY